MHEIEGKNERDTLTCRRDISDVINHPQPRTSSHVHQMGFIA